MSAVWCGVDLMLNFVYPKTPKLTKRCLPDDKWAQHQCRGWCSPLTSLAISSLFVGELALCLWTTELGNFCSGYADPSNTVLHVHQTC